MGSYYGGTVTVKGRNLLAGLLATERIQFTRIVVGSGEMPEGVEPIDMEELVHPVANATSTVPIYKDGVMTMIVEYRNDMNGGIAEKFWLREFGVYAKTENQDEVLLYYATLGDSPQPVNAYVDNRIDIRRYPISIALALDPEQIEIVYNPGSFITAAEAQDILEALFESEMLSFAMKMISADTRLVIRAEDWSYKTNYVTDMYPWCADVTCKGALEKHFPAFAISYESIALAKSVGLCPTIEALDKTIRFYAQEKPTADIAGTLTLFNTEGLAMGETREEDGNLIVETNIIRSKIYRLAINNDNELESSVNGSINSHGELVLEK